MSQELQITKESLPVLLFNFDQLKAWAVGITSKYADLVVTEDAVVAVKKDMADLNKARKTVDEARKEAVRRVSEPIRTFEMQIKDVCAIFDTAYARLGEQVKAFEKAEREEKHKAVYSLIEQALEVRRITMEIPVQDKWLNKTCSMKAVGADVEAIIDRECQQRELLRQAEQARQDRAAAIESEVRRLNAETGLNLPVAMFLGGRLADTQLVDALANVRDEFGRRHQIARETKPVPPAPVAAPPAPVAAPPAPVAASVAAPEPQTASGLTGRTRACSVVFAYDLAFEDEIQAALENIKSLSVNFGPVRFK